VALGYAGGEITAISDAEATWASNALSNAVKYLADDTVGAVTGVHEITGAILSQSVETEKSYRRIYSLLSIAESKLHSTPLFEGELALYRRRLLNGFPEDIGADDTGAALEIIEKGYRAIAVPDARFLEPTPYSWNGRFKQKIRRGQHILQAFGKHRNLIFAKDTPFHRLVFPMRIFLYVIMPFLGAILIPSTLFVIARHPWLLFSGMVCCIPQIRKLILMNLTDVLIMVKAMINEMIGKKQMIWVKMEETRQQSK
jgi:cellulose synthase/poly-beta-1,6-N-acetylglucosamine synthase-like glycosyltransferase